MATSQVYLKKITDIDKVEFKQKIQESFAVAISEICKNPPVIPSDKELELAFSDKNNDSYCIYYNNEKIGGAILKINKETNINSLELFFIYKDKLGLGLGLNAWRSIEELYPDTKIWKTVTPYFEKRNIHFYVNKCGFKIIEFCNKYHQNPQYPKPDDNIIEAEDFFVFEKVIQ